MVQAMAISHPPPSAKPVSVFLAADGVLLGKLADVSPGDEGFFTRAGKDGDANVGIVLGVCERSAQFFHGGHVERIEDFGPVDGDVSDRVFLFEENIFVVHRKSSCRRLAQMNADRQSEFAIIV
jgi:hypothetical protein